MARLAHDDEHPDGAHASRSEGALLERGTANPTTATLLRVARGFGVPVEALFGASSSEGAGLVLRDPVARTRPRKAAPTASSDEALAHRVKSMRLARDWSQHELAA
jgi:transcriptional regulator with XRE-family HTH domain